MHPNEKFLLLTSLLPFLILALRLLFDRHQARIAHRKWCVKHLAGSRRKVGELFDKRPPTHHLK